MSDPELDALRRPFRLGLVAVLAAIVAIGGLVAAFGANADRPAGVAERWLVALSDTTRNGVHDDAIDRMTEHMVPVEGGVEQLADQLLSAASTCCFAELYASVGDDGSAAADGKALFETVQVGRAVERRTGDQGDESDQSDQGLTTELIPAQLTIRDAGGPSDFYVLMVDTDEGWKVRGLLPETGYSSTTGLPLDCPDACPGFPIERPERAPIGFWFGAIALGVLITIGCSAAVRAAGGSRRPATGVAS